MEPQTMARCRKRMAVHVYAVKGTGKHLMVVEAPGGVGRQFRAFTASRPCGTFTVVQERVHRSVTERSTTGPIGTTYIRVSCAFACARWQFPIRTWRIGPRVSARTAR